MKCTFAAMLALAGACAGPSFRQFGQYSALSPLVVATKGERLPQHVTVQLAQPANVAVFFVVPGRATTLLFPADSTESGYLQAGSHQVETSFAKINVSDSTGFIRRPVGRSQGTRTPIEGQRGRIPTARDSLPGLGFNEHGYLLVYATPQPLPFKVLATQVAGISVPIDDDGALNTVTKLVRDRTHTTGTWAAYSTEFP